MATIQKIVYRPGCECFPFKNSWSWARARFFLNFTCVIEQTAYTYGTSPLKLYHYTINSFGARIFGALPTVSSSYYATNNLNTTRIAEIRDSDGVTEYFDQTNYKGAYFSVDATGSIKPLKMRTQRVYLNGVNAIAIGSPFLADPSIIGTAGEPYNGYSTMYINAVINELQLEKADVGTTFGQVFTATFSKNLRGDDVKFQLNAASQSYWDNYSSNYSFLTPISDDDVGTITGKTQYYGNQNGLNAFMEAII